MTNESLTIPIFNHPDFGDLEVVLINGKPHFPATECADKLGYEKPHDAVSRHCRYSVKYGVPHPQNPDKTIEMNFIPEGDLYRLIIRSKLPTAECFERWVFDEILPSVHKHGGYLTPEKLEEVFSNPDTIIKLAQNLKAEQAKTATLEAMREADQPKIIFADAVTSSQTSILVSELAKLLKQNGVDMGGRRLFQWLRDNGWLIKRPGIEYNMPTQKAMERGLFEIKETAITHSDGHITVNKTPKVTGKGQSYFINLFLSKEAA